MNDIRRHMSAAEWHNLGLYVRDLANRLGLRDWTIHVMFEAAKEDLDCHASIRSLEGRKHANLYFDENWAKWKPDEKRHTIVHELLHCHQFPFLDMVRIDLLRQLGQSAYDVYWASFKRNVEYMTDGWADAIAPLMPRYPEIKRAKHSKRRGHP